MEESERLQGGGGRRHAGFTLVELIIVVAILAIIVTLAIFVLGRGGEERAVRTLSNEISQRMLSARMTAIAQGQSVRVTLLTNPVSRETTLRMERMLPPGLGDERVEGCLPSADTQQLFEETYRPGEGNFQGAAVTRVWPRPSQQTGTILCFMPSGRVLDGFGMPLDGGLDSLTGNAYIQISGVRRSGVGWAENPVRRVVLQVPLNGQVTQMPPSFVADLAPDDDENGPVNEE